MQYRILVSHFFFHISLSLIGKFLSLNLISLKMMFCQPISTQEDLARSLPSANFVDFFSLSPFADILFLSGVRWQRELKLDKAGGFGFFFACVKFM